VFPAAAALVTLANLFPFPRPRFKWHPRLVPLNPSLNLCRPFAAKIRNSSVSNSAFVLSLCLSDHLLSSSFYPFDPVSNQNQVFTKETDGAITLFGIVPWKAFCHQAFELWAIVFLDGAVTLCNCDIIKHKVFM
jgi:hypothetical protein